MDDRIGPECGQDIAQEGRIGEIALDEAAVKYGPLMAGGEIVIDEQLMAGLAQCFYDVTAYVAGPSSDEYLRELSGIPGKMLFCNFIFTSQTHTPLSW